MKKLTLALALLAAQDLTSAATSLEELLAARFEGDRTGTCVAASVIEGLQVQRREVPM